MKSRIHSLGFLLVLVAACGDEPAIEASSPSPLVNAHSDRLWILSRTSRVGDARKCADLYLKPDDPRYQGMTPQCDFWTRDYADYLRLNGFPTIEFTHLQDRVYWEWYLDKRQQISDCVAAIGNVSLRATSTERADHTRRRRACDPYDDALYNKSRSPTNDLGIRYK